MLLAWTDLYWDGSARMLFWLQSSAFSTCIPLPYLFISCWCELMGFYTFSVVHNSLLHCYFVAQIVSDLASDSSFQLNSVFLWHASGFWRVFSYSLAQLGMFWVTSYLTVALSWNQLVFQGSSRWFKYAFKVEICCSWVEGVTCMK